MMQSELVDSAALSVLVGRLGICLAVQLWDEYDVSCRQVSSMVEELNLFRKKIENTFECKAVKLLTLENAMKPMPV